MAIMIMKFGSFMIGSFLIGESRKQEWNIDKM